MLRSDVSPLDAAHLSIDAVIDKATCRGWYEPATFQYSMLAANSVSRSLLIGPKTGSAYQNIVKASFQKPKTSREDLDFSCPILGIMYFNTVV